MLKSFVRAAVVTAALVAIPAASQAGHGSRGDGIRECRICKMFSDRGDRLASAFRTQREAYKWPKRDPLFVLAPREKTAGYVREARRPREAFKWPKRDPLFVLAPREERVAHVRSTREARRPLFERNRGDRSRDRR